jgi:signal recognition particle subunit SRP54
VQDALREVRMALLEADVALAVVKDFVAHVRERALGQNVVRQSDARAGRGWRGVRPVDCADGAGERPARSGYRPASRDPDGRSARLRQAPLTSGKLARLLREEMRKKVLLVSCDIYRPAAIEQLKTVAGQVEVDFFPCRSIRSPLLSPRPLDYARKHYYDVVIVDTASASPSTR